MSKKFIKLLYYFILLQPFLDLYWFYHGKLANILPFTLPTIIRIFAVFVLIGLFFRQKDRTKDILKNKWLLSYIALLFIYCLMHLWHVKNFNSINPTNYNYSFIGESFYLVRMMLPLIIIYLTNKAQITSKLFQKSIYFLSLFFAGCIVITNFFIISLRSYEHGKISANIFMWFFDSNIGYSHMASKGFFNFTNTIGAILFMLLPLLIYYLLTDFDKKIMLILALHALGMIELGTKVAAIGLIGGILAGIVTYLIHIFIIKNVKKNWPALIFLIAIETISLAILPFGPAIQRYNYEIKLAKASDHDLSSEKKELKEGLTQAKTKTQKDAFLKKFIAKNYHAYALNKRFVFKSYPYQYDPEFWLMIMQKPGQTRMQNRYIELAMLKKVEQTNNNKLDKVLGISYQRQTNIFNLERDFLSQIFSLGYLGMLLFIGPYLLIVFFGFIKWFKQRTYLRSSLLLATSFMLFSAFYSGNVMDFLTASLVLAWICGYLSKQTKRDS